MQLGYVGLKYGKHLPQRQCPFKTLSNSIIICLFVCLFVCTRSVVINIISTSTLSAENNPFIKGIGKGLI